MKYENYSIIIYWVRDNDDNGTSPSVVAHNFLNDNKDAAERDPTFELDQSDEEASLVWSNTFISVRATIPPFVFHRTHNFFPSRPRPFPFPFDILI